MFDRPIDEFIPGRPLSARSLNRIADRATRADNMQGGGDLALHQDVGSLIVDKKFGENFWIKITDGSNPYGWTEVICVDQATYFTDTDMREAGTTDSLPAYEVEGITTVPIDSIVRAWIDPVNQRVWFKAPGLAAIYEDTPSTSQNDYDTGNYTQFNITPSANINITGFSNGVEGREIIVYNDSATKFVKFPHDDSGSTAANRVYTPTLTTDVLPPKTFKKLQYNSDYWRPISSTWANFIPRVFTPSASQNNYDLGFVPQGGAIIIDPTTPINITGIANGYDGLIFDIINRTANTITLPHLSGSSLGGNKIETSDGASTTIPGYSQRKLQYDAAGDTGSGSFRPLIPGGVGTGGIPTNITVADTTDSTCWVGLFESATGDLAPKTDGALTYNASTGTITATAYSGSITISAGAGTDPTMYPVLVGDATGARTPQTETGLSYNAATSTLTATNFAGNASTVTTNANLTGDVTSVGNASTLVKGSSTFALTGDISPTSLAANTNDWNPAGLSTASVIRVDSGAAYNITGLQGGADGRIIVLHYIGSKSVILKDEDSGSSAANRFALLRDYALTTDQAVILQYDSTSSRWRTLSSVPIGGVRVVSGTSDTLLAKDWGRLVTYDNASAIGVTLPQAGNNFPDGWVTYIQNVGTGGAVTVTPTTSTIDGASAIVVGSNQGAIIFSNGTNYRTMRTVDTAISSPTTTTYGSTITGGTGWYKVTVNYNSAGLVVASTTATVTLFTLPPGAVVKSLKIKHSTAFSGAGVSAASLTQVACATPTLAIYSTAYSLVAAVAKTTGIYAAAPNVASIPSHTDATTTVTASFSCNVNLNNLSAGSVDIWLEIAVLT